MKTPFHRRCMEVARSRWAPGIIHYLAESIIIMIMIMIMIMIIINDNNNNNNNNNNNHYSKFRKKNIGSLFDFVSNRASKITRMLQESIGNTSCRTTMIAHASPSLPFYTETLATVQLASRLHRLRKRKGKVRLKMLILHTK